MRRRIYTYWHAIKIWFQITCIWHFWYMTVIHRPFFFFLEFFRIYNKNKISSYFKRKRKKSIIMQINCFKEIIPRITIFGVALNKLKTIDNQLNIWRRLTELLSAVHIALEIRETRTTRRSAFSVFEIYDKQCRRFTETVDRLVERD